MNAILKLKYNRNKIKNPIKIGILVIRVSSTGVLSMSKPCTHCLWSLSHLPQKRGYLVTDVYYSNEHGEIIKTTLNELLRGPQHISRGHRDY